MSKIVHHKTEGRRCAISREKGILDYIERTRHSQLQQSQVGVAVE